MTTPTLTLLANGHGEDAIAARLAAALLDERSDLRLRALPLVGEGEAYAGLPVERLEPRRALPSGGLTLHSRENLLADLRAGLAGLTAGQLRRLAGHRTDVLVVVGDLYAQALGAFARSRARFVVQPLVSARHAEGAPRPAPNRLAMERITWPERALMRGLADRVYVRDEATAALLRRLGVRRVSALGHPALDGLEGGPLPSLAGGGAVALLPGSRAYASRSLALMLAALERLPPRPAVVAWAVGELAAPEGWRLEPPPVPEPGLRGHLVRGRHRVLVVSGRFADALRSADVALGTSGTAQEQAAALGLPVVSFPVPPAYTRAFLANQARLLGDALLLAEPDPGAIAAALRRLDEDAALRERARAAGPARMGPAGGARRIARDLLARAVASGALPAAAPGERARPAAGASPRERDSARKP